MTWALPAQQRLQEPRVLRVAVEEARGWASRALRSATPAQGTSLLLATGLVQAPLAGVLRLCPPWSTGCP